MSKVDLTVFEEVFEFFGITEPDSSHYHQLFDEDNCYDGWGEWCYFEVGSALEQHFGYESVDGDYGKEGGAEHCEGVIKLKDCFYKASWSYYSYQGDSYEGIENTIVEVKPVEKTIIVYEKI